jgi:hypothetical protein
MTLALRAVLRDHNMNIVATNATASTNARRRSVAGATLLTGDARRAQARNSWQPQTDEISGSLGILVDLHDGARYKAAALK